MAICSRLMAMVTLRCVKRHAYNFGVHFQAGIVHRDVSPWAFAFEKDAKQMLRVTNLSLARKIYDTETKTFVYHRP
jgi:hypothetical protein